MENESEDVATTLLEHAASPDASSHNDDDDDVIEACCEHSNANGDVDDDHEDDETWVMISSSKLVDSNAMFTGDSTTLPDLQTPPLDTPSVVEQNAEDSFEHISECASINKSTESAEGIESSKESKIESPSPVPLNDAVAETETEPFDGKQDTMVAAMETTKADNSTEEAEEKTHSNSIALLDTKELKKYKDDPKATYERLMTLMEEENLSKHDEYGWTPLHFAARYYCNDGEEERQDVIKTLLDGGADVNIKTVDGAMDTPLHMAVLNPNGHQIVTQLLSTGADANTPNSNGLSPLDLAQMRYVVKPEAFNAIQGHLIKEGKIKTPEKSNKDCAYAHLSGHWKDTKSRPLPLDLDDRDIKMQKPGMSWVSGHGNHPKLQSSSNQKNEVSRRSKTDKSKIRRSKTDKSVSDSPPPNSDTSGTEDEVYCIATLNDDSPLVAHLVEDTSTGTAVASPTILRAELVESSKDVSHSDASE